MTARERSCFFCDDAELRVKLFDNVAAWPITFECEKCGSYTLGESLHDVALSLPSHDLHLLAGYTREEWDRGTHRTRPVELTATNVPSILAVSPHTIREKADKLLHAIERRTDYFGDHIEISLVRDYRLAYAKRPQELDSIIHYLVDSTLIKADPIAVPIGAPRVTLSSESLAICPPKQRETSTVYRLRHQDLRQLNRACYRLT